MPASTKLMPRSFEQRVAALRVLEVGVAAVDDRVARREQRGELLHRLLGRVAGRNHQPDDARRAEHADDFLGREAALEALAHDLLRSSRASGCRRPPDDRRWCSRRAMLPPMRPRPTMASSTVRSSSSAAEWRQRERARRASRAQLGAGRRPDRPTGRRGARAGRAPRARRSRPRPGRR